jgi:predicted ester cyclase
VSAQAHHELGRRFFESQDRLKAGPDASLCAPTYRAHVAGNPPMTLDDHQAFVGAFYAAFPDLAHTVQETIADDSTVVVRFTIRGTHRGEFMGAAPTERRFKIGAIAILHIAHGKVAEAHGQYDELGLMRQLGVIP